MSVLAESLGARTSARYSVATRVALVVLGSLVVAGLAQLSVKLPFTPVPITGQTLGVLLVGGSLGATMGGAALLLYLVEGAIGLPFFAGGSSGLSLLKASSIFGGYLWGFVVAALVVGWLSQRKWDRGIGSAIGAMLVGEVIIYAIAIPWFVHAGGIPATKALELGLYPFVVGDTIKLLIAAAALPAAWRFVGDRS